MADVQMEEAAPATSVGDDTVAVVKVDVTQEETTTASTNGNDGEVVVHKKRKAERREKLRKTAICKHFDKPGGCPFPDCKFAHGRSEVKDGGMLTVAAQRKLIREQTVSRAEDKFLHAKDTSPASLRGTMIERYYTELFSCDTMDRKMEDQYVHMHSNRLCVVGVAASHPVMQEMIEQIEFSSSVMESKVTGKKKKGGQFMVPTTILCSIKCKSGKTYALRSCIRGALIEVNERLVARPQLLQERALSDGYLVIIQPKLVEVAEIQKSLLSKLEYQQFRSIVAAADDASAEAAKEAESKTFATKVEQEGEPAGNVAAPLDQ